MTPVIKFLDIYPKEMKTCAHKKLYVNIHSSFICNSSKLDTIQYPLDGEWLNKPWYIFAMEYYTATNRK